LCHHGWKRRINTVQSERSVIA